MAKDPTTVAALWAQRLGNSTTEIEAGVRAVTEAPGTRAARAQQAYLAGVQNNVAKWAKNTSAVTLADWQNSMIQKGLPRISSGALAAQPKMVKFMTAFLPYVDSGAQTVRAMPKNSLQDGIARAVAMINHNANFPGYR